MATKKKSSMAAVDTALAESKKRFDDAVAAEVEIRMKKYEAGLALGEAIGKAQSDRMDKEIRAGKMPGFGLKHIVEPINRHGVELRSYKDFYNKDGAKDASLLETVPKDPRHIGQPTGAFHSLTSEAMSHIDDLHMAVDKLIDQLEPMLRPPTPTAGQPANNVPCQIGSQFTEFLDCLSRRADVIRDRVAEAMSRLSI